MAQSAGRAAGGPRAWPLPPPRRDGPAVGAAPDAVSGRSSPASGQGRVSFSDLAAAFNLDDL
eukprot:6686581-Alexandrium_andersonii.AAC.1